MGLLGQVNGWVSNIADWLSLATFLVTIYTAVTIRRVRREIAQRATLPALIAALEEMNSAFKELLRDFDANKRDFGILLARCEANIKGVVNMRNDAAATASDVLRRIAIFRSARLPSPAAAEDDKAWEVYEGLNGLIEELKRVAVMNQIGGRG